MQIPWQGIQGFSGAIAVGGLALTSLLLLAGVFATNLFLAIEVVSRSTAWAIVVALPIASLAYVVGLLTNAAAEAIFVRFGWLQRNTLIDELIQIREKGEFLIGRFLQLRQEGEILAGGSLALGILAMACAFASYPIEGWRRTLISATFMCVMLCIGSSSLSISRFRSANALANACPDSKEPKCPATSTASPPS
jgi:hypothetical protein